VTIVRVGAPVRLDFSAGSDVTAIHGDIWRGESMSGQPRESFDLGSGQRSYSAKAIVSGRYYILVGLHWSRPLDRGDSGRTFLVEIVPP
jgi:hypothetical protein